MEPTEREQIKRWLAAVRQAYKLARGARLNVLRRGSHKSFDERGLHPYSEVWGVINCLTTDAVVDWLQSRPESSIAQMTPHRLRRVAEDDADAAFARELRAFAVEQPKRGIHGT